MIARGIARVAGAGSEPMHQTGIRSRRPAGVIVVTIAAIGGAILAGSAVSQTMPPPPPPSAVRGELVAERMCRFCHQIRPGSQSDVEARAPSFEQIANTPGRDAAFLRGFTTELHLVRTIGEPPVVMPTAVLSPEARDDVIAYILKFKR